MNEYTNPSYGMVSIAKSISLNTQEYDKTKNSYLHTVTNLPISHLAHSINIIIVFGQKLSSFRTWKYNRIKYIRKKKKNTRIPSYTLALSRTTRLTLCCGQCYIQSTIQGNDVTVVDQSRHGFIQNVLLTPDSEQEQEIHATNQKPLPLHFAL